MDYMYYLEYMDYMDYVDYTSFLGKGVRAKGRGPEPERG